MEAQLKTNDEARGLPGGEWAVGRRGILSRFPARRLILAVLFLASAVAATAQTPEVPKYKLIAAFVYNFAKFVDWPPKAFPSTNSPFVIGVMGKNPFDDYLVAAVHGKTVNGRSFQVKECKLLTDLKDCHILFISESERKQMGEILGSLNDATVLTVSEFERFLSVGGMIQFLSEENKVRFAINDAAAKRARLRISSKLLNLAKRSERQAGQ